MSRMNRISSTPNLNVWQESDSLIHSLPPDNWRHLGNMVHSHSMPKFILEKTEPVAGFENYLNVIEDDPSESSGICSCVGWSSSQSQPDCCDFGCSSEDLDNEDAESRIRTMSVDSSSSLVGNDDKLAQFSPSENLEDSDPYDAAARTRAMSIDDLSGDEDTSSVVICLTHPNDKHDIDSGSLVDASSPEGSFFKLERRAPIGHGGFGLPERMVDGEVGCGLIECDGVTASVTPADSSTPLPSCLSHELLQDPGQVLHRIYRLLCAERVTQMTKTYNDIEAVTRLLEEKERDLELAARIGQTLLSKNKELSSRGDTLDEQLTFANDKINQLKHDLSLKDELLRFYCQDLQDQSPGDGSPGDAPPNLGKINVDSLQKKVSVLEEENITLRLESAQLRSDTETYEEKEKKLVEDCLEQLAEVNQQVETFAGELRLKTEESSRQKEEITALLSQVADLHKRVRQLTIENMDLAEKLQASQESQRQLTKQLTSQQDRYDELFEMLEEAQDELRGHRNRNNPKATRHLYPSAALPQATASMDSLASELQNSMQQEEEEKNERRVRSWKVFETARAARKAAAKNSQEGSVRMSTSVSGSQTASNVNSDSESMYSDGYSADMDSVYGSSTELGRPGIPGSNDLESALRRLALRRANEMNERDFMEGLQDTRSEGPKSPLRLAHTPDSTTSPASGYSYLGYSNNNQPSSQFKMSDKLQIVKPLEGSVTLRHWQRLAQPHLGGLFERREGVKVKGERKLDLEGEVYTLSDFEEDEEVVECPSRRFADSSTIYTFTNSVVSHPSGQSQQLSESYNSLSPLGSSTPVSDSSTNKKAGSSGGYTMSLGLAAILQDREAFSSTTGSVLRPIASCSVLPSYTTPESTTTLTTAASTPTTTETTDSSNSAGLFGKLLNTGYSLLWNKSEGSVTSTSPDVTPQEGLPAGSAKSSPRSTPSSGVLIGGSSSGVLGTMTTFRKSGIL